MHVSQTAEYALRAVICLAQQTGTQTTQQIAECTGLPKSYLPKVLQPLTQTRLVSAQRGVKGGYSLLKDSKEISALEVIRSVDAAERQPRCPNHLAPEAAQQCPLHRMLEAVDRSAECTFASTTIDDLAFGEEGLPTTCRPAEQPAGAA